MSADATRALPQQLLLDRRAAALSMKARDPRSAPGRVRGNVSVAETCEFYGFADAISQCRVPRSCQDCLMTPSCGITPYGQCRNVTSDAYYFNSDRDYRNASFSDNSPVSDFTGFFFLAGTATYCEASDPVCTKCRHVFQETTSKPSSASSNDVGTQFCKGDGGCVCIGICENPKEYVYRTRDSQCGEPELPTNPLPKIIRKRPGGKSDPRAPVVKVEHTSKKEETCTYTEEMDIRSCRRPRTCQECLLKPGCMVSGAECESMDQYRWSSDFRVNPQYTNNLNTSYSIRRQFPSSNTTYCPASDVACAACRTGFPTRSGYDWFSFVMNSYFCVGHDGCVCIEACESDLRRTGVYDKECNQFEYREAKSHPGLVLVWIFGIVFFFRLVYKCWKNPRDLPRRDGQGAPDSRRLWRHMLDEVPDLPLLDLFGWRAHQENLRRREQELLRGVEVTALRRPVDFDDMDPSAPDFDEEDASAPTAQDPKALASAPMYRSSFHNDESNSWNTSQDTDHSSPSAPDFDLEPLQWDTTSPSQSERVGLVTRRSRRGEGDS